MKFNPHIFLAVFLVAFFVQSSYFQLMDFADNDKWVARTINLSQDILTLPAHIDFYDNNHDYRYGAHPGTTIILPAAILYKLGLSGQSSLLFAITLLTSFLTASVATSCHYLRPSSSWWLVAATILLIHPLYFYGTPTNIIIGPTIALLFLLSLIVYEHRSQPLSIPLALFISFVIGLGLSTRLPITVFIAAPLIAFIGAYVSLKRLLLVVTASVVFAFLSNPFFWFLPVEYLKTIILRTSSHIAYTGSPGFNITPIWFFYFTPFTVISIIIALLSFVYSRRRLPVSSPFLLTLFLITTITTGLFITSSFKTLRYFYPLIFIWDILLPLFLLHLSNQFQFPFSSPRNVLYARQITRYLIINVIMLSFGFMALYNLVIPGSQGLI